MSKYGLAQCALAYSRTHLSSFQQVCSISAFVFSDRVSDCDDFVMLPCGVGSCQDANEFQINNARVLWGAVAQSCAEKTALLQVCCQCDCMRMCVVLCLGQVLFCCVCFCLCSYSRAVCSV